MTILQNPCTSPVKTYLTEPKIMYKSTDRTQQNFLDFNQPMGLDMDPDNRWIRLADSIPWDEFEKKYAKLFRSRTGNVAKPFRMAMGSLIIQKKYQFSDRELVEQITENPYLQYFIGLPGYQRKPPFEASVLVYFRKRINGRMIIELNEYMLDRNKEDDHQDHHHPGQGHPDPDGEQAGGNDDGGCGAGKVDGGSSGEERKEETNSGTMMIDATCAPSNIRYPQDFSLLNEAREKLERMIDGYCDAYQLKRPRTYRRTARKNYLALAKCRKRSAKKIRRTIRKQLAYVRRDIGYLDAYMSEGKIPPFSQKETTWYVTIRKLYEQQLSMYRNRNHSVGNRIVSIGQPYIRPIVRGKVKAPVEFGAKFDLSLDSEGYGRIERIDYEAYNESQCLQAAAERFRKRTGHYPQRILADQIYRTRGNRKYCRERNIRLSGPKLGRPYDDPKADKKTEYRDNTDRIEVERSFSLSKRCYGLGLIRTKLYETTLSAVALSVFVTNLFRMQARILFLLCWFYQVFKVQSKKCNIQPV